MIWQGRALRTYGDILDAMLHLRSREEASLFEERYSAENPKYARSNINYMTERMGQYPGDWLRWCFQLPRLHYEEKKKSKTDGFFSTVFGSSIEGNSNG